LCRSASLYFFTASWLPGEKTNRRAGSRSNRHLRREARFRWPSRSFGRYRTTARPPFIISRRMHVARDDGRLVAIDTATKDGAMVQQPCGGTVARWAQPAVGQPAHGAKRVRSPKLPERHDGRPGTSLTVCWQQNPTGIGSYRPCECSRGVENRACPQPRPGEHAASGARPNVNDRQYFWGPFQA
jgi:hypothetical protein